MIRENNVHKSNPDSNPMPVDAIPIIIQPVAATILNFSNMDSAPTIHPNHQKLIDRAREFFAEVEDL